MATTSVYDIVTERILDQLSKGEVPWHKPWVGSETGAINYCSRKEYSPLNQMLLGSDGEYLTFRQIKEADGRIKPGAHFSTVFFYQPPKNRKEEEDEAGDKESPKKHRGMVLRYYKVMHIADTEGIPSRINPDIDDENLVIEPKEKAAEAVSTYLAREKHLRTDIGGLKDPSYSIATDLIACPGIECFPVQDQYYGTLFHLMVKSTAHRFRLERRTDGDSQAREELIAEIGAAMLCNRCGLSSRKAFNTSVAYIQKWVRFFENDKKAIVEASGRARRAVDFILNGTEDGEDE